MKSILIAFFMLILNSLISQNIQVNRFNWEKNPELHTLTAKENSNDEINILRDEKFEFASDGSKIYNYYFFHQITKVNSDEAIKNNNRVYIPTGRVVEMIETKARVINSKGEIIELDQSDIKKAKDDENKRSYNYFALEGLDIGSEIEYYYILKKTPNFSGTRVLLQSEVLTKKLKVSVIFPDHLIFELKSYNGFEDLKEDLSIDGKIRYYATAYNIKGLKEERMSAYKANLQFFIFKLEMNKISGDKDQYAYYRLAKYYRNTIYVDLKKKTIKNLDNFLEETNVTNELDDFEKIRKLENYIKTRFSYKNSNLPELEDIDEILNNKMFNSRGSLKLFATCLTKLDIQHDIVLTSDRSEFIFDDDFEAYCFLEEQFIYVNKLEMFFSPKNRYSRLGYIDSDYTHNYGLFVDKSGGNNVLFIESLDHLKNADSLKIDIKFDEDILNPKINFKKARTGLQVMYTQSGYDFRDMDSQVKKDKELAEFIHEDIKVSNIKVENKGGQYVGIKPLEISADIDNTDLFISAAGIKYLFKIGELIGPQMEMYQEKEQERKLAIHSYHNRSYYCEIKFNIPEGYIINNLDDLNFDKSLTYNDYESSFFKSWYEVKENEVILKYREIYDEMLYPKEYFEQFKTVVNAAADFNKVTLILEKK